MLVNESDIKGNVLCARKRILMFWLIRLRRALRYSTFILGESKMKKSIVTLALLVAAVNVAYAQNSVTLYGVIDESIQYTHNATPTGSSQVGLYSGNLSGSR